MNLLQTEPVSYTHLDVYKRQAQDLSLAYTKVHSVNIPDIVHAYDDKSNDFKYNLRVIEPSTSSDVVAVGNTW